MLALSCIFGNSSRNQKCANPAVVKAAVSCDKKKSGAWEISQQSSEIKFGGVAQLVRALYVYESHRALIDRNQI